MDSPDESKKLEVSNDRIKSETAKSFWTEDIIMN